MYASDSDTIPAETTRARVRQTVLTSLLLAAFVIGGTGCEQEGPMERAGKTIDESVEDAGDAVSDAAEEVEEDAREAKENLEEKIKD